MFNNTLKFASFFPSLPKDKFKIDRKRVMDHFAKYFQYLKPYLKPLVSVSTIRILFV